VVLRTSHSDVSKSSSDSNSSNNNRDSLYRERKDNRQVVLSGDVNKSSNHSNSSNNNRDSLYRERKDNRRVLLPTPHSGDVNKSNSNSNSNSSYSASNNSRNRSAVSSNNNSSNSYSANNSRNRSVVSSNNNSSNSYSANSSRNRSAVNSNNVGHNKKLAAVLDSRLVHTEKTNKGSPTQNSGSLSVHIFPARTHCSMTPQVMRCQQLSVRNRHPEDKHPMSALPPKADIAKHYWDVRFVPEAEVGNLKGVMAVVVMAVANFSPGQ